MGEVQTNEEAQVYFHDLGLFVTVQILEDTPAVLSLGKLCEEHGYSHERVSSEKTAVDQKEEIERKTDNFVSLVVPGIVQYWYKFVFNIVLTGLDINTSRHRTT